VNEQNRREARDDCGQVSRAVSRRRRSQQPGAHAQTARVRWSWASATLCSGPIEEVPVILSLELVTVPVADVDRAKAFYVNVLGFEERFDGPFGEGMRWVELAPADSQATIALVTWFEQMPPGSVTGLVLDTPDAHRAHAALTARGVEFTGDVREDPWGTSASFVDPDGNGWVLMQEPRGRAG
jgi:catechol 2,3-dioxygenase-like lactoylglutathione lyase family enzyme